jgi:hypothetical protein
MIRFRNFLTIVTLLVGAAVLGAPSKAHASLEIFLQEAGVNSGAITQVGTLGATDFTSATFTGTYGDFTLTILGASSDNGATLSDLLSATVSLKNNNASSKTLTIYASQTNFTLPTGTPLGVESGLSGTVNSGTFSGSGDFQAYADKNNNLLGMSDFTNGSQSGAFNGSTFDTGSATGLFNRTAGSPYSLTSVATFTVSGGGQGNFSDHINVTPIPAPAGVVLALTAMPILSIGAWLRRRKVQVQNS